MPLYTCINQKEIEYTKKETHLGLVRTADGKATEAVEQRM
jgi:hypothetical protein